MNVKRYRVAIQRTMNPELTEKEKLSNLGLGIAGEAGEIVDSLKKVLYQGHTMDIPKLIKELGDLEYYLQHLKDHYGISDDIVRIENILKLRDRYPNGFDPERSVNREK